MSLTRSRLMTRSRRLSVLLLGALIAPSHVVAQLQVSRVRDLDFGSVMQGVATDVLPTDPVRSGQFYILTPAVGTRVKLQFTLPTVLNGPAGATMPIAFPSNGGRIQGTAPGSLAVDFNPKAATNYNMTTSPDANVWLGGQVTPIAGQAVGTYNNTVIMTVTVF